MQHFIICATFCVHIHSNKNGYKKKWLGRSVGGTTQFPFRNTLDNPICSVWKSKKYKEMIAYEVESDRSQRSTYKSYLSALVLKAGWLTKPEAVRDLIWPIMSRDGGVCSGAMSWEGVQLSCSLTCSRMYCWQKQQGRSTVSPEHSRPHERMMVDYLQEMSYTPGRQSHRAAL